jgi:hypothetical protein
MKLDFLFEMHYGLHYVSIPYHLRLRTLKYWLKENIAHFQAYFANLGASSLLTPMRGPWGPETNISQFVCVVLVVIYLFQAIEA